MVYLDLMKISGEVASLFDRNSDELGIPKSFDLAGDAIEELERILSEYIITLDVFPDLPNPFRNLPKNYYQIIKVIYPQTFKMLQVL